METLQAQLNESEGSHEDEPSPVVGLKLLGLVRCDLGELTDPLAFDFADKAQIQHNSGSRPWCIAEVAEGRTWESVIESLSDDMYKIHMMVVDMAPAQLDRQRINQVVASLKSDVERFKEIIGEVSFYATDEDELTLVAHEHLDPFWAGALLGSVSEYAEARQD